MVPKINLLMSGGSKETLWNRSPRLCRGKIDFKCNLCPILGRNEIGNGRSAPFPISRVPTVSQHVKCWLVVPLQFNCNSLTSSVRYRKVGGSTDFHRSAISPLKVVKTALPERETNSGRTPMVGPSMVQINELRKMLPWISSVLSFRENDEFNFQVPPSGTF